MTETRWTPSLVEERLVEAADILKRMPPVKVQGYFSTWPKIVYEFSDLLGQEPPLLRRPFPSPAAISRMEETLGWTIGLDVPDARIVWLRAYGARWKEVCRTVGLARAAAHEHWLYALCVIAWRLNGNPMSRHQSRAAILRRMREEKFIVPQRIA